MVYHLRSVYVYRYGVLAMASLKLGNCINVILLMWVRFHVSYSL